MSFAFMQSADYTIMSHVMIFNNLCSPLIILTRLFMGRTVHKFEKLGTGIAMIGVFITAFDAKAQKVNPQN